VKKSRTFLRKQIAALTVILISVFSFSNAFAQETGELTGNVSDSVEAVIGAVVVVEGNNLWGDFTDADGNFTIKKIKPGTYNIQITYFGYKTLVIKDVVIRAGESTSIGDVKMELDAKEEAAIVIVGTRTTNTEQAAVTETKESKQVINVISAEQISKSQDRDAAQVMQRIPGVTLVQNRFVMVRGLSERYNTVLLNGAVAPSSEAESRAFSFDLISSNMIDRISVYKSGSFDQPGDFAGSAIRVYTRNSVEKNTTQLSLTGGYRVGTTFGDFKRMDQFGSDALGFGANKRALPSDFPELVTVEALKYNIDRIEKASSSLPNNWSINDKKAYPDGRLNFLVARKMNLGGLKINTINNLSYSNTLQRSEIERHSYWNYTANSQSSERDEYDDQSYSNDVRLGALSNWSFIMGANHKIDFRNMYSQLSSSDIVERVGTNYEKDNEYQSYSLRYSSNRIYTGQLQGTHNVNKERTKLLWSFGYSDIARKEPDWRRYSYQRQRNSTGSYDLVIPSGASATDAARFYTELTEKSYTGNAEIEHKFVKNADSNGVTIKMGFFTDYKDRSYSARWMSYTRGPQFNPDIQTLPIGGLLDSVDYFKGVTLNEGTRPSDVYSAKGTLLAYYAGTTIPFLKKFNLTTGARLENNNQTLVSLGNQTLVDTNVVRLLPSANLSYNISKKMLVRGAYYRTLNRPEFRELSAFSFYDFNFKIDKVGNPKLKTADIHNMDVRVEYYPSSDEMISIGVFYKKFINPIELYQLPASSNFLFVYGNADVAESQGIEVEIRKSLGFISKGSTLEKFSLLFNGALIESKLTLGQNLSSLQINKRAMQGQSPYVINTGIYFTDEKKGWQASLMYNVFGPRIYAVGDQQVRTWYEMQRHLVDLTISKNVTEKLTVRVGASDLLNSSTRVMEDGNFDGKINDSSVDKVIFKFKTGQYFTLGFNYKF